MKLTFRRKIFVTYVAVFLIFLALIFPFSSRSVKRIVINAMEERSSEIIEKIQTAPNNEALIRRLKEQKAGIFFRMSVITQERKILYDSHTKRLIGPQFSQEYIVSHPEVLNAFKKGKGYHEGYSKLLSGRIVYLAKTFDFHGKTYVLRTAFPYKYVVEMTRDFEMGFLVLASGVLLLFSVMTWFIINYLTSPIAQIIGAIKPYQEGKELQFPNKLTPSLLHRHDEFGKLAETLSSLSVRIQQQINQITQDRNEKETLLESLVEGVIAVEQDMTIIYANQAAYNLLSIHNVNLIGSTFAETHQQKCFALLIQCQKEKCPLSDTIVISKQTGKTYLDVVVTPIKGERGAVLVLQDRTAQHKILEMKKEFVANASHELKTPVTVIQGFAETLHDNPNLSQETIRDVTSKIVRRSKEMTNLIRNLLTLADIEHIPEHRLVDVDLNELVKKSSSAVQEVFPEANITIHCNPSGDWKVFLDPSLIQLALKNLIENAVKYSHEKAIVDVRLERIPEGVCIDVEDHGIGISEDDIPYIFDRFYTVNKIESRKKGGSGLGLSIVHTIISKHGGSLSVTSKPGLGSTFRITLPYRSS